MSLRARKAVARRFAEAVDNRKDLSEAAALLAPDAVIHLPGADVTELSEWKASVSAFLSAFPDLVLTVHAAIAEGDLVALRWSASGTHLGPFAGLAPTGQRVHYSGVDIYRIRDGRIAEAWVENDSLGLMRQIGAVCP